MSPSIDTNDFNTKVKNAMKFLKDGNRVKVTVRFRGREMAHTSLGADLLKKFGSDCAELATVAKDAKLEGRQYVHVPQPQEFQIIFAKRNKRKENHYA